MQLELIARRTGCGGDAISTPRSLKPFQKSLGRGQWRNGARFNLWSQTFGAGVAILSTVRTRLCAVAWSETGELCRWSRSGGPGDVIGARDVEDRNSGERSAITGGIMRLESRLFIIQGITSLQHPP